MSRKRIVASYVEDPMHRIVILAAMTAEGLLLPETDASGYVVDWDDESESYNEYSFVLEPVDEKHAMLRWGDDATETRLDVMGRRLVSGETISRRENGEDWCYSIDSVVAVAEVAPSDGTQA